MHKIDRLVKKIGKHKAKIAIVIGVGFNEVIKLENEFKVSYKFLGIKYKKVDGQSRDLTFGYYNNIPVVLVSRLYYYETGKVDYKIKVFKILERIGVKTVILTDAAGAINTTYNTGDAMMLETHINFAGINPLINKNPIKFLDMANCYDKSLKELASQVAKQHNIKLHKGTHLQVSGPTYETLGEIKMYRTIGADTVSMSMAFDCICAKYFNMNVLAFVCITNKSADILSEPLSHDDILTKVKKGVAKVSKIITGIIKKIKFE